MDDPKSHYGDEYPDAVAIQGIRMPLEREGRFSRYYYSSEPRCSCEVSKFQDGTARITFAELEEEWSSWSEGDRSEFAGACGWLMQQADFPDMLRFLMRQDEHHLGSRIALHVAGCLPREEAFDLLRDALDRLDAHTANITQAIAATRHPEAARVLFEHLDRLWQHPRLWDDDSFSNWPAFDAVCCIAHLIELGVAPAELEDKVRLLAKHVCAGNRDSCGTFLHRYYGWLEEPEFRGFAEGDS